MGMMSRGAHDANMESAARAGYGRVAEQARRIADLEAALRTARAHLVTLGGDALSPYEDGIQRAVLNEIDKALKI